MRLWQIVVGFLWVAVIVRADQAEDLARIHLEVIGGKGRIDALQSMRASGYVVTGGKKVRFTLLAARPNRLRLETGGDGRSLVQASDGESAPWKMDTSVSTPQAQVMGESEGRLFSTDAEFDDPLVGGAERGFAFDFAGDVMIAGRKMQRVLVTRKLMDTFALLVDADTYFILAKIEQRQSVGGRRVEIVTRYDDYRPVAGVLLPHKVAVMTDGKLVQQTVIEAVEANPAVTRETFVRPMFVEPSPK